MKKFLLTVAATAMATSVFAQGTVLFANTTGTAGVKCMIYGTQAGNSTQSLIGNTTAGTPAGTQTYTGTPLSGSGYLAQILAVTGANAPEGSLVAASTSPVSFRTGSSAGYFANNITAVLSGVAADAALGTVTLQVVVWDNSSGSYSTWAQANTAWQAGLIAAGKSTTFNNATALGGGLNSPGSLAGLTSFNIYYVPEPSTMALAGLGAAALLIFRRRK